MRIEKFLAGHAHWKDRLAPTDLLKRLVVEGQKPEALVICCSDSRVIPEFITGAEPGNLFVVRNVANLIPPHGANNASVSAALAYGIEYLGVSHLIVLGHYGCGGMGALRDIVHGDHKLDGPIADWLQYGRPSWDELIQCGHSETADWHERLVEENVLQQLAHAVTYPVVTKAVEAGTLILHAWTYDMITGEIRFWDGEHERFLNSGMAAAKGGSITLAEVHAQDHVK